MRRRGCEEASFLPERQLGRLTNYPLLASRMFQTLTRSSPVRSPSWLHLKMPGISLETNSCYSKTSPTWLTGARNLQSVLHHHQVALNLPWASLDLPVYFLPKKQKKERIPNNPYPDWHTLYVNINKSYRAIIKETALPLSIYPPASSLHYKWN